MKTKMRVLKSTNDKSTKTIISISPCAASGVLKFLHENRIPCDYMGLDQSGRILMEVYVDASHDALMKEINAYMEKSEEIANAITQSVNDLLKKQDDELNKILQEQKKKREERRKASTTI